MPHYRKVLGLAVTTALAVLAPSVPAASAAMTTSSASVDNAFAFNDLTAATPSVRHITATSDGAENDPVDILCMQGATSDHTLGSTTLGPGGALSYDVPENIINDSLCRVAVVPSGQTTADPNTFSGPTIGGGYFKTSTSNGHLYNFQIDHAYSKAYTDFYSLGDCGLCDMALLNVDGQQSSSYLFYDNAYLSGTHSEPNGFSRPDALIDGTRAYPADDANNTRPGFAPLSVSHSQDPATGDMTYTEEQDLMACAPNVLTCSSYTTLPIHYTRVAVQDHGGRVVRFTDTLTNTDTVKSHDYDLDFEQFEQSSGHNGFRFPGESGYATHVAGDVVSSGFTAISTIGFVKDTTIPVAVSNPLGTLTVSPQPVRAVFGNASGFNLQFKGTLAPGGSKTIEQDFSMGETQAEVDAYAAEAEASADKAGAPSIAITEPVDGTTVNTPTVTVKGTASDNKAVTSLKLGGTDVALAADGTWSGNVTLNPGANTITAVAKDAGGNEATAIRTITYVKPGAPVVAVFATVSKNGKVKVTRKGSKVTVDTGIKVSCPAGSASCTAAVDLKTIKAVAAKLKKSKITIAKKTFTIAAGTTKKIVLTLSSKGAKALKRNKKLTVKVTVVAKVGAGAAKTTTRTITIKYPKATK